MKKKRPAAKRESSKEKVSKPQISHMPQIGSIDDINGANPVPSDDFRDDDALR